MAQIFFGVGTGRVASMAIANALNTESNCLCLHEGKVRDFETPGEQVLPFLTLQNRRAYEYPDEVEILIDQARGNLNDIADERGLTHLGDIAYNNSPFIGALNARYEEAKFIFLYRDCLGFLMSCTSEDSIDETPVGWPPPGKALSRVEQYIGLGRLQPRQGSPEALSWAEWTFTARNIWLWAETNRLILDALGRLPARLVFRLEFEKFRRDPVSEYRKLRQFLAITDEPPQEAIRRLTTRPINFRRDAKRTLSLHEFNSVERAVWNIHASSIRAKLGYSDGIES